MKPPKSVHSYLRCARNKKKYFNGITTTAIYLRFHFWRFKNRSYPSPKNDSSCIFGGFRIGGAGARGYPSISGSGYARKLCTGRANKPKLKDRETIYPTYLWSTDSRCSGGTRPAARPFRCTRTGVFCRDRPGRNPRPSSRPR